MKRPPFGEPGGGGARPERRSIGELFVKSRAYREFRGGQGRVTALTFAPDGRLLAGGLDTTVLAWDMRPPRVAASVSLASAWNDLATREAGESFKSDGPWRRIRAATRWLWRGS